MKKTLLLLLCILFIISACSKKYLEQPAANDDDGKEEINDMTQKEKVEGEFKQDGDKGGDRLKYVLQVAGKTDKGNELIEYSIQNLEEHNINLHFNTSMKYDYYILNENGKEIYRDSDEKQYTQALENLELKPGEEKVYKLKLPDLSQGEYILVLIPAAEELSDAEAEIKFNIK